MGICQEDYPQPQNARQPVSTVFQGAIRDYGQSIQDIQSHALDDVEKQNMVSIATKKCFDNALQYFEHTYPEGDPLHDVVVEFSLLVKDVVHRKRKVLKPASIYRIVKPSLSEAIEALGLYEIFGDVRIFDDEIEKCNDYIDSSAPVLVGRFNITERADKGDAGRDIRFIEDVAFILIPEKFYDKSVQQPLESLCDVLKVAYETVRFLMGKSQKTLFFQEDQDEDAGRLVSYFLSRVMCEDSSVNDEHLISPSLQEIIDKHEHDDYLSSVGIRVQGSLTQFQPALN